MRNRLPLIIIAPLFLIGCAGGGMAMNDSMNSGNGMMQHGGMMGQSGEQSGVFLPAQGKEIATLPEAKPSEALDIADGASISLTPTIVRKTINGKQTAMYGYNGQIPGPLLRVKQGSTFTVHVTNAIDLPTTIHWHGLRLSNANDGTDGMSQSAIQPGQSFDYTIVVPDEGMYWYHTHVREDLEQPMGLYGGILVTPKAKDAYEPVDREEVVMVSDLLLDDQGKPVPYGAETADHTLMGRFGNTFLVNGQTNPHWSAQLGEVVRYYVVNASNTRTYRILAPQGGGMKVAGGDNGRLERERKATSVILAPSERVIVDVNFLDDDVNRGTQASKAVPFIVAGSPQQPFTVLPVTVNGGIFKPSSTFGVVHSNADVIKDIDAFRSAFGKEPDHTLQLTMTMHDGMVGNGMMRGTPPADGIEWEDSAGMMNGMSMGSMMQWKMVDVATGAANKDIVYTAKIGDKVKFRIVNTLDSPHPMQHPIHFHGQRFLVLSDNGVANDDLGWKDTVLVPSGHTVDILVDASNPGDWMFHCHIAEHLSNGMMGTFSVQ